MPFSLFIKKIKNKSSVVIKLITSVVNISKIFSILYDYSSLNSLVKELIRTCSLSCAAHDNHHVSFVTCLWDMEEM